MSTDHSGVLARPAAIASLNDGVLWLTIWPTLRRWLAVLASTMIISWGTAPVLAAPSAKLTQRHFDIIIRDARIVDGTGAPSYHGDVGVNGDTIAAIGNLAGATAEREVIATGRVLTPGFIDLHAHVADGSDGENGLLSRNPARRAAQNYVAQGITTVLGNPDGFQAMPLRKQRKLLAKLGIGLNIALTNGHNGLRAMVMGEDQRRPANAEEIRRMQLILQNDLAHEGSFGLSLGTEYFSGRYASADEQVELARVLPPYNGIFIPHLRSQGIAPMWYRPSVDRDIRPPTLDDAVDEVLRVAHETGATVVFTHLKAWGPGYRGRADVLVDKLRAARARGGRIYADVYPYDSSGSDGNFVAIPSWAFARESGDADDERFDYSAGLAKTLAAADAERLADLASDIRHTLALKGGPENVVVLEYPDAAVVGKRLSELMTERSLDDVALILELQRQGDPHQPGGARMRSFSMADEDIKTFYRQPWVATSTDGWVVLPEEATGEKKYVDTNRRVFGSFPRRIAHYSREAGVDSLEQAIRSMSGLPAQILSLADRGRIAVGMKADLAVLDLERLRDNTTYLEPSVYPDGIGEVLVNGRFVVEGGRRTLALPGRVLTPTAASAIPSTTNSSSTRVPAAVAP